MYGNIDIYLSRSFKYCCFVSVATDKGLASMSSHIAMVSSGEYVFICLSKTLMQVPFLSQPRPEVAPSEGNTIMTFLLPRYQYKFMPNHIHVACTNLSHLISINGCMEILLYIRASLKRNAAEMMLLLWVTWTTSPGARDAGMAAVEYAVR